MQTKTLILGIGNTLLSDEGVGIHALSALAPLLADRADVELIDGGTLSFTLASPIEEADTLIVIDAAQLKSAPGTVQAFRGEAMDAFLTSHNQRSVHEVGLLDLMAIARLTDSLPQRRMLIGVQPQKLDWGMEPTPVVAEAIPTICALTLEALDQWQS